MSGRTPRLWSLALFMLAFVTYDAATRARRVRTARRLRRRSSGPGRARAASSFTRPQIRRSPTRFPIVLAHGYFGFDAIGTRWLKREYFRGIRSHLESLGCTVHVLRVSPAAGVAHRAEQLAEQIRALDAERVNIVAHSMGGLDARYAIARLGLDDKVASLTTIGTPHHGTPLLDPLMPGDLLWLRHRLELLGAHVDGIYDLTTASMEEFNRLVLDSPDVAYSSVVGAFDRGIARIHALLAAGHEYLSRRVGPNDGMVPCASQRWGKVVSVVKADHLEQVGWSRVFDAPAFYGALAGHLGRRGY